MLRRKLLRSRFWAASKSDLIHCLRVFCAFWLLSSVSYSQTPNLAKMSGDLRADETLAKTNLSAGELNEILKQVEETAFDAKHVRASSSDGRCISAAGWPESHPRSLSLLEYLSQ